MLRIQLFQIHIANGGSLLLKGLPGPIERMVGCGLLIPIGANQEKKIDPVIGHQGVDQVQRSGIGQI